MSSSFTRTTISHAVAFVIVCFLHSAILASERPNIVIVLADDLGWGDPQCYQTESKIPTPAINRMAAEGVLFTDAHTPSSVCTPTRYGLLTGRYCWRTRLKYGVLDGFDPPLIDEAQDTLPRLLKRSGYRTHCVGKWHLGMQWEHIDGSGVADRDPANGFRPGETVNFAKPFRGGPLDVGFDTYFGIAASLDMSPYCYLRGNRVVGLPTESAAENKDGMFMNQVAGVATEDFELVGVLPQIAEEAARVIRDSANREEPFLCYVPLTSPHLPVVPTPESIGTSMAGEYGDFVVATDNALARILTALDAARVGENTLVIFTSDNGGLFHWWGFRADDDGGATPITKRGRHLREFGHRSNAHWRGTKADIHEGGHRVPFLVRWPDQVRPGREIDDVIELTDVYATIAEIVGEVAEQPGETQTGSVGGQDSFSFKSLLLDGNDTKSMARPFSIHHSLKGMFAIRRGPWKLIAGRGSGGFTRPRSIDSSEPAGQLYNLVVDPQETKNLYDDHPEVVRSLTAELERVRMLDHTPR